jgi:NAD(P)-dependent dehydrogenase (short-subunit alcohol dehydrogenase family)
MHALARIMGDLPSRDVMEALGRAADVDAAAGAYFEALDAARRAAGVQRAAAEFERLDAELARLWRLIAFTPARTLLGGLAKLDAVAAPIAAAPLPPEDFRERCSADDVARMAAADLAGVFRAADEARP